MKKYIYLVLIGLVVLYGIGVKYGFMPALKNSFFQASDYSNVKNTVPLKNGVDKEYYENGKIRKETPYVNGKREGAVKQYYPNGSLKSESMYRNNQSTGMTKTYYETGELEKVYSYQKGRRPLAVRLLINGESFQSK